MQVATRVKSSMYLSFLSLHTSPKATNTDSLSHYVCQMCYFPRCVSCESVLARAKLQRANRHNRSCTQFPGTCGMGSSLSSLRQACQSHAHAWMLHRCQACQSHAQRAPGSPWEHTGHDGLPAGGALRGEGTAVAVVTEQLAVLAGEGLIS